MILLISFCKICIKCKSGTYVNEGLNYLFKQTQAGDSGAVMYYCKDTNNTCTPNTVVNNNATVESYNGTTTDYYIRYQIVSNAESKSAIGSYNAKFDLIAPVCNEITGFATIVCSDSGNAISGIVGWY